MLLTMLVSLGVSVFLTCLEGRGAGSIMPTAVSPLAWHTVGTQYMFVERVNENDHMLTFSLQERRAMWAIFIFFFMLIFSKFSAARAYFIIRRKVILKKKITPPKCSCRG